jgi:bile acid-coenzyme A ligase
MQRLLPVYRVVGPEAIWELYGGIELQGLTYIDGRQWLSHRGFVGVVVSGEMKVLDDAGRECAPGEEGEIYLRSSPGSAPTYGYIGSRRRR